MALSMLTGQMNDVWVAYISPRCTAREYMALSCVNREYRQGIDTWVRQTLVPVDERGVSEEQRALRYAQRFGPLAEVIIRRDTGGWLTWIRTVIESGEATFIAWCRQEGLFPLDVCNEVDIGPKLCFGVQRVVGSMFGPPALPNVDLEAWLRAIFNIDRLTDIPDAVVALLVSFALTEAGCIRLLRPFTDIMKRIVANPATEPRFMSLSAYLQIDSGYSYWPHTSPRYYSANQFRWTAKDVTRLWCDAFQSTSIPTLEWLARDVFTLESIPFDIRYIGPLLRFQYDPEKVQAVLDYLRLSPADQMSVGEFAMRNGLWHLIPYCATFMTPAEMTSIVLRRIEFDARSTWDTTLFSLMKEGLFDEDTYHGEERAFYLVTLVEHTRAAVNKNT